MLANVTATGNICASPWGLKLQVITRFTISNNTEYQSEFNRE